MNIDLLFKQQRELDKYIENSKDINVNMFQEKCLALIVELAELANEVRSFKYWSNKKQSEKPILLNEFVDVIHFLLSIGNDLQYNNMTEWPRRFSQEILTKDFLETNISISRFISNPNKSNYINVWEWMDVIRVKLKFSYEEIEKAYVYKNKINYDRQKDGY